eukprot:gnl/Chilomastix_cuspidata/2038.p1 GENE.gnl/Chilomastix_cuspidata/2038~~gnl/Chilomastix_cuspidata/2038.p1  ORF type:complete len:862 (+),score=235.19 gnl/Chilomastix_cuspidata/2038:290-2587(+)
MAGFTVCRRAMIQIFRLSPSTLTRWSKHYRTLGDGEFAPIVTKHTSQNRTSMWIRRIIAKICFERFSPSPCGIFMVYPTEKKITFFSDVIAAVNRESDATARIPVASTVHRIIENSLYRHCLLVTNKRTNLRSCPVCAAIHVAMALTIGIRPALAPGKPVHRLITDEQIAASDRHSEQLRVLRAWWDAHRVFAQMENSHYSKKTQRSVEHVAPQKSALPEISALDEISFFSSNGSILSVIDDHAFGAHGATRRGAAPHDARKKKATRGFFTLKIDPLRSIDSASDLRDTAAGKFFVERALNKTPFSFYEAALATAAATGLPAMKSARERLAPLELAMSVDFSSIMTIGGRPLFALCAALEFSKEVVFFPIAADGLQRNGHAALSILLSLLARIPPAHELNLFVERSIFVGESLSHALRLVAAMVFVHIFGRVVITLIDGGHTQMSATLHARMFEQAVKDTSPTAPTALGRGFPFRRHLEKLVRTVDESRVEIECWNASDLVRLDTLAAVVSEAAPLKPPAEEEGQIRSWALSRVADGVSVEGRGCAPMIAETFSLFFPEPSLAPPPKKRGPAETRETASFSLLPQCPVINGPLVPANLDSPMPFPSMIPAVPEPPAKFALPPAHPVPAADEDTQDEFAAQKKTSKSLLNNIGCQILDHLSALKCSARVFLDPAEFARHCNTLTTSTLELPEHAGAARPPELPEQGQTDVRAKQEPRLNPTDLFDFHRSVPARMNVINSLAEGLKGLSCEAIHKIVMRGGVLHKWD